MKNFRELALEAVKKMPDSKIDLELETFKNVRTFKHDPVAAMALAKVVKDVIVTKDSKFMHVDDNSKVNNVVKEYDLEEVK